MSLIIDVANKLADMPNQALPIYPIQFPGNDSDGNPVINCVAIFPGDSSERQGTPSLFYTALGTLDFPSVRVQVRYIDPFNAFVGAEAIRIWLEANLPTGYLTCRSTEPIAKDVTDDKSLAMSGGPAYVFEVVFQLTKVRS